MSLVEYLEDKANILRLHSARTTTRAGSGHPTTCFSAAEIVATLFFKEMKIDPQNLDYLDNDEFVLSKGHGAPLLYAALAEIGSIARDRLETLREFSSELEGHPVPRLKGIRVGTGSLGQGLAIGLGMAYAKKLRNIDRRVYVLLGDGEMAEGSVWESINFAGKLGLPNLTAIVDVNRLAQSGPTMYEWDSEAYAERIKAFDWDVHVCDGHNVNELVKAIGEAKRSSRPSFIVTKTVKGKGVSFLENADGRHGKAMTKEELAIAEREIKPRIKNAELQPANLIKAKIPPKKAQTGFSVKTDYKLGDMVATRVAYGKALANLGEQTRTW